MPKISPQRKSNEKWCCGCKKFKQHISFYKSSKRKDGYTSWCKDCSKKFELTYKRKRYVPKKDELRWWKRKVLRRKLKTNAEYLLSLYIKNPQCYYCKISLKEIDIHLDHKTPKSREGTDKNENIALSCEDCNRLKNNKTEQEFIDFLRGYCLRFEK